MTQKLGPNVKKLAAHYASKELIPPSGGLQAGMDAIMEGRLGPTFLDALQWVESACIVVRAAAEPNPWRDADDETIAAEVLRRLKERESKAL